MSTSGVRWAISEIPAPYWRRFFLRKGFDTAEVDMAPDGSVTYCRECEPQQMRHEITSCRHCLAVRRAHDANRLPDHAKLVAQGAQTSHIEGQPAHYGVILKRSSLAPLPTVSPCATRGEP